MTDVRALSATHTPMRGASNRAATSMIWAAKQLRNDRFVLLFESLLEYSLCVAMNLLLSASRPIWLSSC